MCLAVNKIYFNIKIYITTLPVGFEPTTSKLTACCIDDFATEDGFFIRASYPINHNTIYLNTFFY
jgi:hypothetical protein